MQQTIDRIDALIGRPEYDDAVVVGWRVHPDVAETTIESDQGPRFGPTDRCEPGIGHAAEAPFERGRNVMASDTQERGPGVGKILVRHESQTHASLRSVQRGRLGGQREAFLASEFGSVRESAPDRVRRK